METVFITIHDLTLDARIKFCSASIEDILGYAPPEVKGKSCWDYFHPDEIPFAKSIHTNGIDLDKAAVLNYCRIKHKDGSWIGCECVFTVVHDVLVASTSIYKRGPKATRRALDGAHVRRIFSSSPKDPRYHMLSYLSGKFYQEPQIHWREPRAALFLNRFTRSSTIMYATNSVSNILGVPCDQLTGKSFYYCIAENCLPEAVKCLESAKANDSIAYLRFTYRDPTQPDARARSASVMDLEDSEEEEDGGVRIESRSSVEMDDVSSPGPAGAPLAPLAPLAPPRPPDTVPQVNGEFMTNCIPRLAETHAHLADAGSTETRGDRSSSGNSTDLEGNAHDAIFDRPALNRTTSSATPQDEGSPTPSPIELEAVVSCTSDGLVVILRRAHPLAPTSLAHAGEEPHLANGLFASPWAPQPVMPEGTRQTSAAPGIVFPATPEPIEASFMAAIRDVAVFAWSLTGINGSLTQFARKSEDGKGEPTGEALPPGGLVEWDPHANVSARDNEAYNGFNGSIYRPLEGMGDPHSESTSSDDEVVWKREPQMSVWRRPKRRQHADAFGAASDGVDGESEGGSRKRKSKNVSRDGSAGGTTTTTSSSSADGYLHG